MAKIPDIEVKGGIVIGDGKYRPCWVQGKRALFHRWADTRRPVTPRGIDETETDRRYQVWTVHAIVEFEDGKLARVYPSEVEFADPDFFEEMWREGVPDADTDDAPGFED
jgi:hypothetical protein